MNHKMIEELIRAVETNDIDKFKSLINNKNVNIISLLCNSNEDSLLHLACKGGHIEIAKILIEEEANVHQSNKSRKTPLKIALEGGHIEITKLLIEHGATAYLPEWMKQKIPDYVGAMEWCKRAFRDDPIIWNVNLLSAETKNMINTIVANTFIHNNFLTAEKIDNYLARHSTLRDIEFTAKTEIIKNVQNSDIYIHKQANRLAQYLSEEGWNFPFESNIDWMPKEKSAAYVIEYLKSYGVSSYARLADRILTLSNKNLATEIQKMVAEEEVIPPANLGEYLQEFIIMAIRTNDIDQFKSLINNNKIVDINRPNYMGYFALKEACSSGNTEIVKLLLEHGANVNQPDFFGTSLHAACKEGHTEIVKLLLEHGANVNQPHKLYGSPLHVTCAHHTPKKASLEIVKLLIEHGDTSNVIASMRVVQITYHLDAQKWCNNAFQDHPVYDDANFLPEGAKNIIKTIVANKFIDNNFTAGEIDQFFRSHSSCGMLQAARDDITEIALNIQADKIAKYLSEEEYPYIKNLDWMPQEKLAAHIIEYLKSYGVSSYAGLASRALCLGDNDHATEIQKAIADEITRGAHLEEYLEKSITGKNLKISYFNPIFLECIKENTEEKTIAQLLNELKETGLYEFSDFLEKLSNPDSITEMGSEFKELENFDKMPDYKKILIASRFENPGNDFAARLTDEQSANLDGGLQWALNHLQDFVLEKDFMNLSGDHHDAPPHGDV